MPFMGGTMFGVDADMGGPPPDIGIEVGGIEPSGTPPIGNCEQKGFNLLTRLFV